MHDSLPCTLMRGGSSKGAYFLADDLPADRAARDDLLRRVMGSPDPRQIDGIGGAHPLTSKVAVIARSSDDRADVEYLFLQVGVDDDVVTDRQNCGNLLAGVGPFALQQGLVDAPDGDECSIRILMLNTDTVATARFAVRDGVAVEDGDTEISGVPGSAAPIHLEFEGLAGGSCGALLPSGNVVDELDGVPCTLIDNGMPVVVMRAADLGVSGHETCEELESNSALRERLERIRLDAGERMNLGDVSDTTVPKLTLVAPPRSGGHLATRTFIPHRCHDAIGVLGAVSVATAALVAGSAVHDLLDGDPGRRIRLEHPTGFFDAVVEVVAGPDGSIEIPRAGIVRTARTLMRGTVFARPIDETT